MRDASGALDVIERIRAMCKDCNTKLEAEVRFKQDFPEIDLFVLKNLGPYQAIERGHRL